MSVSRSYQSYPGSKRQPPQHPLAKPNPLPPPQQPPAPSTPPTSNHEEVVRFIQDGWLRATRQDPSDPDSQVTYYQEKEPNPMLKDFKPIDLDAFCERRRKERSTQNSS